MLALRQVAQRLEATGALVVPLAEETVHVELVEEAVSHEVVAALGRPHRLVVAAAHVRGDRHVRGPAGQGLVDRGDVGLVLVQRVTADVLDVVALHRVVDVGEAGVVQLQVAAAEVVELRELLPVRGAEVVPELAEVRVDVGGNRVTAAAVVHHGRRRDRQLGRLACGDVVADEREGVGEDRLRQRDRGGHVRGRRGPLVVLVLVVERDLDGVVLDLLDTAELVDEVHVPRRAAQLAVGRRLQADLALHANDLTDRFVFNPLEVRSGDQALGELVAGLVHFLGPQEAPDMIGTERRTGVVGHATSSLC